MWSLPLPLPFPRDAPPACPRALQTYLPFDPHAFALVVHALAPLWLPARAAGAGAAPAAPPPRLSVSTEMGRWCAEMPLPAGCALAVESLALPLQFLPVGATAELCPPPAARLRFSVYTRSPGGAPLDELTAPHVVSVLTELPAAARAATGGRSAPAAGALTALAVACGVCADGARATDEDGVVRLTPVAPLPLAALAHFRRAAAALYTYGAVHVPAAGAPTLALTLAAAEVPPLAARYYGAMRSARGGEGGAEDAAGPPRKRRAP